MRVPQSAEVEAEALIRIEEFALAAAFDGDLDLAAFWIERGNQQEAEWLAAVNRELSLEGGE